MTAPGDAGVSALAATGARMIGDSAVSPLGLGGARWSLTDHPDEDLATRTLRLALDLGITLIDTAPAYTTPWHRSHNEELIGRVLADLPRRDVFLVTKAGHYRDGAHGFPIDGRPETIKRQCRSSLTSLGVDEIDLYLLHWPDPVVPLADSVGALADLRDQGLVRMIGVSNVDLGQLAEARSVTAIAAVENRLSILDQRGMDVLRECATVGISHLCYSPLGGPAGAGSGLAALPDLAQIAQEHGATAHQIAIAWLLGLSPGAIPIVGAGRPDSVRQALEAAGIQLAPAQCARLGC